jgi:CubicO group peptidase (beta-lactamase class C family)
MAHGYHTWTYGWLAGEVIRRLAGVSVGNFVAKRIAKPVQAEFWIGLPEALNPRVAPVLPPHPLAPGTPLNPFTARMAEPSSLTYKAWASVSVPSAQHNEYPFRSAEVPAANGIGTARALSRLYAACIGEIDDVRLLTPETLEQATRTQARGEDLVQPYETHFGTGFQLTFPFRPMAGPGSFGHYGSGGSVGFGHQELGISFGYTMNQMGPVYGKDPRTSGLVEALLTCLR